MTERVSTATDADLRRAFDVVEPAPMAIRDRSKVKIRKDSVLLSGDATFYTLQGEGTTMGMPCTFCRLHNCNLACSWCDAFYTWFEDSPEFWTEPFRASFAECAQMIIDKWGCKDSQVHRRVIFSGGEPLIQKSQIDEVIQQLGLLDPLHRWKVEIETNGTLMPTQDQLSYCQFNCSPKLRNSDNKEHSMVKPKVLVALDKARTTFKFVCETDRDLEEIEELYLPHISKRNIVIMPQGIRSDEIDKHMRQLYEPCMSRGYRLLGRMQAQFADGARRGV